MKYVKSSFRNHRKRHIWGIMAIVMFISVFSVMEFMSYDKSRNANAAVAVTNDGRYIIPNHNTEKKVGTEENPYVVLEVVPNVSMASFGYLVKGQEPINIAKAISEDTEVAEKLGAYVEALDSQNIDVKEFKNLISQKELESEEYIQIDNANQYGEFKLAETPGTGNYILKENVVDNEEANTTYVSVGGGNGEYEPIYEYVGPGKGNFEFDKNFNNNYFGFKNGVRTFNGKEGYLYDNKGGRYYYVSTNSSTKQHPVFTQKKGGQYNQTGKFWYAGTVNGLKMGSYNKVVNNNSNKNYTYTFTYVASGGDYIFEPKNYKESSIIKEKPSESGLYYCHDGWFLDNKDKPLTDDEKKVLKGYVENVPVLVKYKKAKGYSNSDLFKKFGIGLAYKSNDIEQGEDVSKYEFAGWYTEKQCVNKVNEDMRLYKDTTIYAKWITKYPSDEIAEAAGETDPTKMYVPNYTISFNKNAPDTEEVYDMPQDITYIEAGKSLVSPNLIPKRKGKVFDGWCVDSACTQKYMFSSPVTSNMVLYAKWVDLDSMVFKLQFNSNTFNTDDEENVVGMPDVIYNYCRNGMSTEFTDVTPAMDPTLEGYTFAGWYYNKACTKAFTFGTTLSGDIGTDTINLYAKWIPNNSNVYRLTFDANEPDTAISEADTKNYKTTLNAKLSGFLEEPGLISSSRPTLEGNISAKVSKYNVEVITITPDDFKGDNKENNLKLIERANLIVFNQTVNENLVKFFDKYKSEERFGKRNYSYGKTNFGGKSDSTDISWDAAIRMFKKVAVGSDEKGKEIAPIIFDSNIIKGIDTSSLRETSYTTSDNKSIKMNNSTKNLGIVSSKNIFKLYLLTQQMNPVTFYNAYYKNRAGFAKLGDANTDGYGVFSSFGDGKYNDTAVWSFKTLFPVEAVTKDDWDIYNTDNGAATGVAQVLGFNDNPLYEANTIVNRTLVTGNVLFEFINQNNVVIDEDMKNFYKEISGKNSSDYSYNMTDALYYLTHADVAITNFDESLNVLDIEPSDGESAFKSHSFWFWYISKYIGNFSSTVTVTKKSSSEFVGDIDDLNSKYDIIFIGSDISTLADEYINLLPKNGNNEYYSYAHTGAVQENIDKKNAGALNDKTVDSMVTSFVGSGNDITERKYKELLTYAEAGYPIVFGRDLLSISTTINGNVKVEDIDTNVVDKSTYIYKLMKTLINDEKYSDAAFFENQYNASNARKFREALEIKKFSVSVMEKPTTYVDKTSVGYNGEKIYINENDINAKALKFRFKINGKASNMYTVKVYIDTNADGKYSEEEKLDSLEIYDVSSNRHVRYNRLVGGHTFDVSRVIDDYVGAIPWKLEIYDNNNRLARNSMLGMCAIKVAEKTKLNILHMVSNHDNKWNTNNLYFPTDSEINEASHRNASPISPSNWDSYFNDSIKQVEYTSSDGPLLTDAARIKNAGMFYYYLSQLSEFEVHFTRMTVKEFEDKVKEQNEFNSTASDDEKQNFMNDYNMLILGYADCFSDVNDASCAVINKYINEGNTTLFTHDNTSYFNLTLEQYNAIGQNDENIVYWGYNINQYFRKILGMDRYDVMINKGNESLIDASTNDKPYMAGYEQSEEKLYKFGNKVLTQGATNGLIRGASGANLVNTATKTNDGQIVSYPYKISDSINIAGTHSQYYQLDLEEEDIVVWYTLYDNRTDKKYAHYSLKNDVRNNYYIYNKGNITYTGVGHSCDLTDSEVKLFINTMIAAYNATVQPTVPVITNADKSTDNENTDYVYVDYDATVSASDSVPFGNGVFNEMPVENSSGDRFKTTTKRIYFTLKNNSIVLNKEMTVHYFPAFYDEVTGEFKQLSAFPLPLKTYRIDNDARRNERTHPELVQVAETTINIPEKIFADNASSSPRNLKGAVVESNEEYFVDIPITDEYYSNIRYGEDNKGFKALDEENEFAIQVQVIMRYGREQTANTPLKGFRNVLLMRRGMFALD